MSAQAQRYPSHFTCPCGKAYAPTKAAARDLYKDYGKLLGDPQPVRYYECEYAAWHWTRQVRKEH